MKILLVHPGASMSTADVHSGLVAGLRALGQDVYEYSLDARIHIAGAWMSFVWRKGGKVADKPTPADILYKAGEELTTRALRLQPDVVLIVSAMFLHPDVLVLMKRAGLKVAVLFTESPYDDEPQAKLLPYIDVAWTNERTSAQDMGIGYLPHALNADVHHQRAAVSPEIPSHDVVFVGTGFQERIDTLASVDWDGIDLGLYGSWDLLGSRNKLRQYVRGSYIENAAAAGLYRQAKIGLNLYRTSKGFGRHAPRIDAAESLNPRAYELAATGCFSVSDYRAEVWERFGDRVPTFRDPSEMRPLLDRWLADDAGRQAIQAQLPACVVNDTWHNRAHQLLNDLVTSGIGAPHEHYPAAAAVGAGG